MDKIQAYLYTAEYYITKWILDMKALFISLLFSLLFFQFSLCFADSHELKLISKSYQLISVETPNNLNQGGLFFPPNVIQFDEKNNISYHLIDTNKIAIKEHINGALIDIIEVPIKESHNELPRARGPTIMSITLDSKRNHLWLLTSYNSHLIYDLSTKDFATLKIKMIGMDYRLQAATYDAESDSTFAVYTSEGRPGVIKISNETYVRKHLKYALLKEFDGYEPKYSLLKVGANLVLWEGAFYAEKIWVFKEGRKFKDERILPLRFEKKELFDNDVTASQWWGILPRIPYSQINTKSNNIVSLTVNNAKVCENFRNEVAENFMISKHLFDSYRQNVFGLNKFDYTKLAKSTVDYTYEQEIEGARYYISPRTLSGCGSRCETKITTVTPGPLGKIRDYLKGNPEQPKAVPYGQHNLATDDNGQLHYVSFNANNYNLHKFNKGKWGLSCQVKINPTGGLNSSENGTDKLKKELGENLKQLSVSVLKMIGETAENRMLCKGAHNTSYVRKRRFHETFELVSSRPNEFKSTKNYVEVFEALKNWSYGGLYEYQIFMDYQALFDKSLNQLSRHYQQQFGYKSNEAKQKAEYALKSAVSTGINPVTDISLQYALGIRKSILEKQPTEVIKAKITQSAYAESGSILNLAVVYPEALNLLIKDGFDVNQRNAFGKTPLMYAAQYNQFESINLLLAAQADPNLMTHQPKDNECAYSLGTTNLSSLHYAVRYADFKSIKALIDNGAWLELKALVNDRKYTSTALDWLVKHRDENKYLSDQDVEKLKILLAPKQEKELRRVMKNLTIKAEKDYHNGKLDLAYKSLKLITSSVPDYIRALSDFSLVALKVKDFETALDVSERILMISKKDSERASAYFNVGLTCEKIPQFNDIDYFKLEMCHKGLLVNFFEALLLKRTESRKNKVHEVVSEVKEFCTIKDNDIFTAKLYVTNKSSRISRFIVAYIKKNNLELLPLDFSGELNLKKKVIKRKVEVDMVRKETYQDEKLYIEKVMLAVGVYSNELKKLCL